jgi:haloacetate dehalogenase
LPERLIIGREEDYLRFFFSRVPELLNLMHADGTWDEYVRIWNQPGAVEAFDRIVM